MSKLGKKGHKCHFWNCFKLEKDKRGIVSSSSLSQEEKTWERGKIDPVADLLKF